MPDPAVAGVEKVFASVLGGMEMLSIALGDRLGFYAVLAEEPLTADDLAARAGTDPRWTREWLEQQAVVGYLTVTDGRFALVAGVAETLAQPDALTTMAPAARMIAAAGAQWTRIADGARTGAGLGWQEYGPDMRESQAELNRPPLEQLLPDSWLAQALPDVHRRLAAGEPLLVADVGCGGGWAAIGLARRWPSVTVHAYDVDGPSVELARSNVERAGLADRVTVHEQDIATEPPGQTYDLALAVECIHDMPRPVPVLAAMRRMVGEDGHVLLGGFDGDANAYQLIADNYMDACGVQNLFLEVDMAFQAFEDLWAGKKPDKLLLDPGFVITQANLQEKRDQMWGYIVWKKNGGKA